MSELKTSRPQYIKLALVESEIEEAINNASDYYEVVFICPRGKDITSMHYSEPGYILLLRLKK